MYIHYKCCTCVVLLDKYEQPQLGKCKYKFYEGLVYFSYLVQHFTIFYSEILNTVQ